MSSLTTGEKGPFFQICPHCGLHGRIVFPTGHFSLEVDTKRSAILLVDAFYKKQFLITDVEVERQLEQEINDSNLPFDASETTHELIVEWNEKRMKLGEGADTMQNNDITMIYKKPKPDKLHKT